MRALGIDTSNYTTSAAVFDGSGGYNAGRLLEVRPGELGLRQSDALFQHIKPLPGRFAELQAEGWLTGLSAVGASTRPRAVEGSYMPCFLAGEGQGQTLYFRDNTSSCFVWKNSSSTLTSSFFFMRLPAFFSFFLAIML